MKTILTSHLVQSKTEDNGNQVNDPGILEPPADSVKWPFIYLRIVGTLILLRFEENGVVRIEGFGWGSVATALERTKGGQK